MRFGLLGPLEVHDGAVPVTIPGPKAAALLATLLCHANQPVSVTTLCQALWGEHPPSSAAGSLQNHVARLRRALGGGSERIEAVRAGYRLRVGAGELDAEDFADFLRRAESARARGDWLAVSHWTAEAEALWRAVPLADAPVDVLQPQVQRLVAARAEALEWHFDAAVRLGRHAGLAARLAGAVAEDPLNEALAVLLMQVLHRTGRRAQALEVFQQLRRRLVDDLGIEPSVAAQAAQRAVLDAAPDEGQDVFADTAAPAESEPGTAFSSAATRLPEDVATFVGRWAELDRIVEACGTAAAAGAGAGAGGRPGVYSVDGMPGVGKSTFAVRAAHRVAKHFPDGMVFVPLQGHTPGHHPVDPADALTTLLLGIGVPPQNVPDDRCERAALWRDRARGRRMLIVFDDAHDSNQVRPLLPSGPGSLVLVTSRRRLLTLDNAVPVTLGVLTLGESAELFVAKTGRADLGTDNPHVAEAVRLCGHLPLAIHLLAARLRHHSAWNICDLVADLAADRRTLAALKAEDVSVAAAFDLSYRGLPADRQRLFRRLGLLPGDDVDVHGAAALSGLAPATARSALEDLEDHHLLEEISRGRYRMHDLIREHARALSAEDDAVERREALDRLIDYYLRTAGAAAADSRPAAPGTPTAAALPRGPEAALRPDLGAEDAAHAWMLAEIGNIQAAIEDAAAQGRAAQAVDLAVASHRFLRMRGQWQGAGALSRLVAEAARQLGHDGRLAVVLAQRALVDRLTGAYPAAEDALAEALALFASAGDTAGRASVLRQRGITRRLRGNHAAGMQDLEHALELFRGLGDAGGQASVLVAQAHGRQHSGRYESATQAAQEALTLFRTVGDRQGQANALAQLGDLEQWAGRYADAEATLRAALALYQAVGDRSGEANTLIDLGLVHRLTGRLGPAAAHLHEAVGLTRSIGRRLALANALTDLGGVQLAASDPDAAARSLREALLLCRRLDSRVGRATVLLGLAELHLAADRRRIAAAHLGHALRLFTDLADPAREAETRTMLGRLAAAEGRFDDALADHGRAAEIAGEIGAQLHQARALEGLGAVRVLQDRDDLGEPLLREAWEMYRRLGTVDAERVGAQISGLRCGIGALD